MRSLTADDRRVLLSRGIEVGFGCEVLDASGGVVEELGADLLGGSVSYNAYNEVARLCELQILRELDWDNVWLRPWQSITAGGHTVDANLGVFRPTKWPRSLGDVPVAWDVSGADKVSLLQDFMGDSRWVSKGTSVLDAVSGVLADAQVPGRIIADSTASNVLLDQDLVWLIGADAPIPFIRCINDMLGAVSYRGLWVDADGNFRIDRYVPPEERAAEFTFDLSDPARAIVSPERSTVSEGWSPTNHWTFLRAGIDASPAQVDGSDGLYVVDLAGSGRKVRAFQSVTAADASAFVAEGDRVVATARSVRQRIEVQLTGFPVFEHFDVVDYIDPELPRSLKCQVVAATGLDLRSGDVHAVLEVASDG